jgi:ADP-heptose:LPS heptosyltransferase
MASRLPSRLLLGLFLLSRMAIRSRRPGDTKRILVAHHLYLGDTIMLTPLLAKLRQQYPTAEIVMTTPAAIAPLYQHRPYGVQALPYDPRDASTLRALWRHRGFDLALVPGDNRFSWLAYALGARRIIAFSGDRPPYKSWPVTEFVHYGDEPVAWGDMVADMIQGPTPPPYGPAQWSAPDCSPFTLPSSPYCVLHVGASSPLKLWTPNNWIALADKLTQQGYTVVWSGSGPEKCHVDAIDPGGRFASYAGQLDLPQLWRLLSQASLLVSPDTGVAHLGRIANVPTVTLFGPGSHVISGAGKFWGDGPHRAVTVDPFPCRDQHGLFKRELTWVQRCYRRVSECGDNKCMQAISVDAVAVAADAVRRKPRSVAR